MSPVTLAKLSHGSTQKEVSVGKFEINGPSLEPISKTDLP